MEKSRPGVCIRRKNAYFYTVAGERRTARSDRTGADKNFTMNPLLPQLPARLADADPALLTTAEEVDGCAFRGAMPPLQRERLSVGSCTFTGCLFPACDLRGAQFYDVVFRNCDLSNADLREACFHRVVFTECKLLGANFAEAALQHVVFERCKAGLAVFAFMRARTVRFSGCGLHGAAFDSCRLERTEFVQCDLTESDFSGTRLKGLSFADSDIRGIRVRGVNCQELNGVKISRMQACDLALLLGVELVDE